MAKAQVKPKAVPTHQEDPLLTLTEVAKRVGKTRPTVAQWVVDGLLECTMIGRLPHVRESVLDKFLGGTTLVSQETQET